AEGKLREAMRALGLEFVEARGEASFYGPKLDVQEPNVMEKDETISTVQIDFYLPERFGLEYIAEDSQPRRPVMIHRAVISTLERMMAFLIEAYAGAFPLWLAPEQVRVLPIADRHVAYARRVEDTLRTRGVRAEVERDRDRVAGDEDERAGIGDLVIGHPDDRRGVRQILARERGHGRGELDLAREVADRQPPAGRGGKRVDPEPRARAHRALERDRGEFAGAEKGGPHAGIPDRVAGGDGRGVDRRRHRGDILVPIAQRFHHDPAGHAGRPAGEPAPVVGDREHDRGVPRSDLERPHREEHQP